MNLFDKLLNPICEVYVLGIQTSSKLNDKVQQFIKLVKLIIKLLNEKIDRYCIAIIETSMKILQVNLIKNSPVIGVISYLVLTLDRSVLFRGWLSQNYSAITEFLLKTVLELQNSDIIKNLVELQTRILNVDPDLIINSSNVETLLKSLLQFLGTPPYDYFMVKEILNFINLFICQPSTLSHPLVVNFIPEAVGVLFKSLPQFTRNLHQQVKRILLLYAIS